MTTYHHRRAILSQDSFRALRKALPELGFERGMERGFSVGTNDNNRVAGRYIFTKRLEVDTIDEDTLKDKKAQRQWKKAARFDLVQRSEIVWANAVEDLNALEDAFNAIPGVDAHFAKYDLDLGALSANLQTQYKKNTIETLGIRDYLAREQMMASAQFKILEPAKGDDLRDKFRDQLSALKMHITLPDGVHRLTLRASGGVTVSDEMPDEVLAFVRAMLQRYHKD